MSQSFQSTANGAGQPRSVETVILVDVDGVLNVGARDSLASGPLLLNIDNISRARTMACHGAVNLSDCAQMIVALSGHTLGPEEDGTFTKLVANSSCFSEVCVGRLVDLIKAVDPQPRVVLSSSWRHERHHARRESLRRAIQDRLGRTFHFDGSTPLCEDTTASSRLECIGEYLASLELPAAMQVRLLVLDDFFITPLHGWSCSGVPMDSAVDVERYLLNRCSIKGDVKVKVVHPYTELTTNKGLLVRVGMGLTLQHFTSAMDFVMGRGGGSARVTSKRGLEVGCGGVVAKVSSSCTLLTRACSLASISSSSSSSGKQRISPELDLSCSASASKAVAHSKPLVGMSSPRRWLMRVVSLGLLSVS